MFSRIYGRERDTDRFPLANHANFALISGPAVEPVSLDEAKQHLRLDFDSDDALVQTYIQAARERMELWLRRSLITQTWDLILDWGPAWVELPRPPIQSVTGVYTTDLSNTETTVPAALYYVSPATRMVTLNLSQVWPLTRGRAAFRIRYVAGYGDTPETIPASIRATLLNIVGYAYDTRNSAIDIPDADQTALRSFRIEGAPWRMSRQAAPTDILA